MGKGIKTKKFSPDEISVFCDQLALMMNGGIAVFEAVHIINSETEDKASKAVLEMLDKDLADSVPLFEALEKTNAFPKYMVHMVKVGETTGKLEEVMRGLADYYERESNIMTAIKNAVAFPIVLFAIMAVILLVLVWKILPLFEKMFDELSADVSATAEKSLNFGMKTGTIIAIATLSVLAVIVIILLFYRTKSGERTIKNLLTKFRGTGKLARRMATGKFLSSMSLMLAGGMNITEALNLSLEVTTNKEVCEKIERCRDLYEKNAPFDEALRESGLIGGMEGRMVTVGVKSGATDEVFAKLSRQYNDEITAKLTRISSVIETVLVVVLAVLVGAVLLSVMIPLVGMISSIA